MKDRKGFTLLELLVVIGIIGILVAIGTVSYSSAQNRSRDSRRRQDLEAIANSLEAYYADNAVAKYSYPSAADCTGYEDYLSAGTPTDPKWGFEYTDPTGNTRSGGSGAFCAATEYCICVEMEAEGGGNAYGRSGTDCTWTGTGDKNYFCVQNKQ